VDGTSEKLSGPESVALAPVPSADPHAVVDPATTEAAPVAALYRLMLQPLPNHASLDVGSAITAMVVKPSVSSVVTLP
jgi:hypothetical protein